MATSSPITLGFVISYFVLNFNYHIYVTAGMDISAGSVPAGPNLTGGMELGMNTNI